MRLSVRGLALLGLIAFSPFHRLSPRLPHRNPALKPTGRFQTSRRLSTTEGFLACSPVVCTVPACRAMPENRRSASPSPRSKLSVPLPSVPSNSSEARTSSRPFTSNPHTLARGESGRDMLRVAAARFNRTGKRVATWIICVSNAYEQKANTTTPDAGTRTRSGGFDRYPLPKRFPPAADLGQDLWKPRCPVPNVSARVEIATQVSNHTIHPCCHL